MCTLATLCFCGRRRLLVLLRDIPTDCNDGFQKNKKGSKASALTSGNGSMAQCTIHGLKEQHCCPQWQFVSVNLLRWLSCSDFCAAAH